MKAKAKAQATKAAQDLARYQTLLAQDADLDRVAAVIGIGLDRKSGHS